MLVLGRKEHERVYLFVGDLVIAVVLADLDFHWKKVRLAFEAPPEVEIVREELLTQEQRERVQRAAA